MWTALTSANAIPQEEQDRNADTSNPPESAEWLNEIMKKLIPIINTDLLLPIIDILEDALKNRFPTIIAAVRIEEIDLGVTPMRLNKMKRLDPAIPIADKHEVQQDNSRHVNMEVEFAYNGKDRQAASVRPHFRLVMDL